MEPAGVHRTYASDYLMRRYRGVIGERRPSIVNVYDYKIRYADKFLSKLRATFAAEGYANAPIMPHSDHGDELGEHANYGHRPLMYDTLTCVPLVMQSVGETGRVSDVIVAHGEPWTFEFDFALVHRPTN